MRRKPTCRLAPHSNSVLKSKRVKAKPFGRACRAALTRGSVVPRHPNDSS
jgi:hypothetical protein